MLITLMRKNKSWRNFPSIMDFSRWFWVVVMMRMLTWTFPAAQTGEFPILKDLEQFGLNRNVHFPDIIQQNRPAICQFEFAGLLHIGARESPLLKPEELAFQKGFGDGGAVHLDKGLISAQRTLMDRLGDQIFPGPAFPLDQDGDIGLRDLIDHGFDAAHFGTRLEE